MASSLSVLDKDIKKAAPFNLEIEYLSSSEIAERVLHGAPCDAVLLLDDLWLSLLLKKAALENNLRAFAKNRLILASYAEGLAQKKGFAHLDSQTKIIVADPKTVPLGRFTEVALSEEGVYDRLKENFLIAHSAQAAKTLLLKHVAQYAVLFASDIDNKNIFLIKAFDSNKLDIIYRYAACKHSQRAKAERLEKFLFSEKTKNLLLKMGFLLP